MCSDNENKFVTSKLALPLPIAMSLVETFFNFLLFFNMKFFFVFKIMFRPQY